MHSVCMYGRFRLREMFGEARERLGLTPQKGGIWRKRQIRRSFGRRRADAPSRIAQKKEGAQSTRVLEACTGIGECCPGYTRWDAVDHYEYHCLEQISSSTIKQESDKQHTKPKSSLALAFPQRRAWGQSRNRSKVISSRPCFSMA